MSELVGIARFRIHEGKLEEFKRLSAEAMEIVKTKDTGTLRYDTYFNDDESECVIVEVYRDSQAASEHAEHLGELSTAVLAIVSVVHGELLGDPSEEIRARLASSEIPQLLTPTRRSSASREDGHVLELLPLLPPGQTAALVPDHGGQAGSPGNTTPDS